VVPRLFFPQVPIPRSLPSLVTLCSAPVPLSLLPSSALLASFSPHSMGANCLCSHAFPDQLTAQLDEQSRELQVRFQILIGSGGDDQSIGLARFTVHLTFDLVCLPPSPPSLVLTVPTESPCLEPHPPRGGEVCRQQRQWLSFEWNPVLSSPPEPLLASLRAGSGVVLRRLRPEAWCLGSLSPRLASRDGDSPLLPRGPRLSPSLAGGKPREHRRCQLAGAPSAA
jgi:hypothetical protein